MASLNRMIRDAMASVLAGISAESGYPISVQEVSVVQRHFEQVGKFPHLIVEFPKETKKQNPSGWVRCTIQFFITGYLRGKNHDAEQDLLAQAIEQAIAKDPTFNGLALDAYVIQRTVSSSWLQGYGIVELFGEIIYHHPVGNP